MPSWTSRWFLIPFFTVLFAVFYAIAFSVLLGLRDNYRRYAQKAELQWTGPGRRPKPSAPSWRWVAGLALISALAVVEGIILR